MIGKPSLIIIYMINASCVNYIMYTYFQYANVMWFAQLDNDIYNLLKMFVYMVAFLYY